MQYQKVNVCVGIIDTNVIEPFIIDGNVTKNYDHK